MNRIVLFILLFLLSSCDNQRHIQEDYASLPDLCLKITDHEIKDIDKKTTNELWDMYKYYSVCDDDRSNDIKILNRLSALNNSEGKFLLGVIIWSEDKTKATQLIKDSASMGNQRAIRSLDNIKLYGFP